ncbi:MAG: hypothetical protein KGQ58_09535 [Proteobacteria bacterium]|nr:hypothetical protein [Pseudomonadota bacterium]MDE3208046.1 hypothetical protein [Pseudomonadota bacterium]
MYSPFSYGAELEYLARLLANLPTEEAMAVLGLADYAHDAPHREDWFRQALGVIEHSAAIPAFPEIETDMTHHPEKAAFLHTVLTHLQRFLT